MYVCICNGITETQVVRAIGNGARRTAGVYRRLGCAPQCGKCVPDVLSLLRNEAAALDRTRPGSTLRSAP